MPVYAFVCPECGGKNEVFRPIGDRNDPVPCDRCEVGMERDLRAESDGRGTREFDVPIEMWSIACSSQAEVDDLRRQVPDVEFAPHDPGVPIARTRQQKLRLLDACGFEEKG